MVERIARFEHEGVERYGVLPCDGMLDLPEGPGDAVETEGIGVLRNPVVAEGAS